MITGKTAFLRATVFLRRFRQICVLNLTASFSLLWIMQQFSLHSEVISFASNPQPGGPDLCICHPVKEWHSYTPGHRAPFSSPSTIRRATVDVILTRLHTEICMHICLYFDFRCISVMYKKERRYYD
jgi:hypothetical protein